jgi:3-dehydroquinate synthase
MTIIPVELPQQTYRIAIAPRGLEYLGQWLTQPEIQPIRLGKRMLLVSNPTVFEHYGNRAIATLEQAGFQVKPCILPDGEQYKTLASVQTIYDTALDHRLERSSTIVAVGGGVIGDMAGFAAATWLRGIAVVQVPTSLLAMVDASIGGKTGVNHPHGKNLIGAFHQPRLVFIDPQVLQTLPEREFRAGMAEVIKYGVIWDLDLFQQLEAAPRLDQQQQVSDELMYQILTHSCQAKAQVVSKDEKESGLRAILNYGHTIGHAIETLTGYRSVNHGEAVAIGMVAAGQIAVALNLWDQESCDRQLGLIQKAHLPTQIPTGVDIDEITTTLQTDKKVQDGQVRFILPTHIGAATIVDQVPADVIRQVLEQMMA